MLLLAAVNVGGVIVKVYLPCAAPTLLSLAIQVLALNPATTLRATMEVGKAQLLPIEQYDADTAAEAATLALVNVP